MTRFLAVLMSAALLCTGCTALPAEEKAFAVALCAEKQADTWHVYGRIPKYQTGGGYLTVSGEGDSPAAALADMEEAAPMRVHLSQLRLLVLDEGLAENGGIREMLHALAERPDWQPRGAVALTNAPAEAVSEALKPAAGARLSKAMDVLLETRIEQGRILPAWLGEILRMGERQSPVLMALTLEDKEISLSGGIALTDDWRVAARLDGDQTVLLSLLLRTAKQLQLNVSGSTVRIRDAAVNVRLQEDLHAARVEVTLRMNGAPKDAALEQHIADACADLLSALSAAGCDVLGLGRKAILGTENLTGWHRLDWPSKLRMMQWTVAVTVQGPA